MEQSWTLPASWVDHAVHFRGQAAGQVFRQAAAGDVGHAVYGHLAGKQGFNQGSVETGWGEQGVYQVLVAVGQGREFIDRLALKNAAHQAEAIAMDPTAGHRQDAIPGANGPSIDQGACLDHGHAETGQVVAARGIEARHFGRFAAKQGAAALAAAVGDALHHLSHGLRAELACGDVIKEEKRLGPAGDYVVDAHRHQVDAHIVVAAVGLSQLKLGANPVGARDQQGIPQPGGQSA